MNTDENNTATGQAKQPTQSDSEILAEQAAGSSADPSYQAADLQNLTPGATGAASPESAGPDVNLDVILDVPVTISVEIGRTQIPVRQLLQYNQGSVVELDRHVGEPLDVLVNNTLIAHGEVVMIDDRFGLRLTDVISPTERVKKLR